MTQIRDFGELEVSKRPIFCLNSFLTYVRKHKQPHFQRTVIEIQTERVHLTSRNCILFSRRKAPRLNWIRYFKELRNHLGGCMFKIQRRFRVWWIWSVIWVSVIFFMLNYRMDLKYPGKHILVDKEAWLSLKHAAAHRERNWVLISWQHNVEPSSLLLLWPGFTDMFFLAWHCWTQSLCLFE